MKSVLIIAPKTVAQATWQDEAAKWEHTRHLAFSTVMGSEKERLRALNAKADCYVINRDNVAWLMKCYKFKPPFDMLVVDESSSFKNSQSKRFKALRKARLAFARVVLLTGTPAPNSLMDLWPQMYLLDGGAALGHSLTSFRDRWFMPEKRYGAIVYSWRLRSEACRDEIADAIKHETMSLKAEDYLSLPERIDNIVSVTLDKGATKDYQAMKRDLVLELKDKEITVQNAAALMNKLQQMANGRVYDADGAVADVHGAKLAAMLDIAEANEGTPLLVFYAFRHDLDSLRKAFPDAKQLKDAKDAADWNAGKIGVLLAHPSSAAYGLNLQAGGNVIVWYGLTWNLELYQQANARLHRQGQGRPVIVHHLVAKGTVDETIMAALRNKRAGQDALLEAVKAIVGEES